MYLEVNWNLTRTSWTENNKEEEVLLLLTKTITTINWPPVVFFSIINTNKNPSSFLVVKAQRTKLGFTAEVDSKILISNRFFFQKHSCQLESCLDQVQEDNNKTNETWNEKRFYRKILSSHIWSPPFAENHLPLILLSIKTEWGEQILSMTWIGRNITSNEKIEGRCSRPLTSCPKELQMTLTSNQRCMRP
jgi:hypothetical protein